ncbi:MAG: FAD-dependent monooxygenase, partial [Actinomycetes bacterium]
SDGVVVRCADDTRYECDAVIGADGLRSTVRRLFSTDDLVCGGYVTYRGVVPTSDICAGNVSEDVVLWIAPGMHLVQLPIRRGELYRQAAVFRSSTFATSAGWGGPQELDERFATACPQVRRSVAQLDRDRRWPVLDREPLPAWVDGRLALLGDAAHPVVHYLAQGAAQALEDAAELASALDTGFGSVNAALRAYQDARVARATRVQIASRRWGELLHTDDPLIAGLRDRYLGTRRFDDYSEADWLYADPRSEAAASRVTPISATVTAPATTP